MTDAKKPGKEYCPECHELSVLCACKPKDPTPSIRAAAENLYNTVASPQWHAKSGKERMAFIEQAIRAAVERELKKIQAKGCPHKCLDTTCPFHRMMNRIRQGGEHG